VWINSHIYSPLICLSLCYCFCFSKEPWLMQAFNRWIYRGYNSARDTLLTPFQPHWPPYCSSNLLRFSSPVFLYLLFYLSPSPVFFCILFLICLIWHMG
jgi:hypothetical protein